MALHKGPSIKDVRRDGGRGFGQMRTGGGGKGPCGRPQAGTFLYCFSMLCRHSLCGWCLLKYKLLFILYDLHHRV